MKFLFLITNILFCAISMGQTQNPCDGGSLATQLVGQISCVLNDHETHQQRTERLSNLIRLYENRANSCENELNSINRDLISPQLYDDITSNDMFNMVYEISLVTGEPLRPGILYGNYRTNFRNHRCKDLIEREGLDNRSKTLGLDIQGAVSGINNRNLCQNYDRMINCFKAIEDIILEEETFNGMRRPSYFNLEHFDHNFVQENFSVSE